MLVCVCSIHRVQVLSVPACSGLRPVGGTTMPSADFCSSIGRPLGNPCLAANEQISPGMMHLLSSRVSVASTCSIFWMSIGLRVIWPHRPDLQAFYALRVPRTRSLLTASSRPRLTTTALAVRLTVPLIRVRRGLSPPSKCALPGAPKEGPRGNGGLLLFRRGATPPPIPP